MDLLSAHRSALRQFDARVQLVTDTQWGNSTPDTDWSVKDLVGHLVNEQLWVPPLMAGRTIEEVGDAFDGDVLGDDPKGAWNTAAAAARAAFEEPGALDRRVHLSFGVVGVPVYLEQMTLDLTVHAWDLARGIGADDEMPNDLVSTVLENAKRTAHQWQDSGLFAPAIPVPGCTDDLTELLALLGRHRWWSRSA
jgi:uncharacterized protein (TIGR03086 family)